jgi:hypothetical protein
VYTIIMNNPIDADAQLFLLITTKKKIACKKGNK